MARLSFSWRALVFRGAGSQVCRFELYTTTTSTPQRTKNPSEQSISTLQFRLAYCEDGDIYSVADTRINKLGGRAWRVKCWDEKSHILSRKRSSFPHTCSTQICRRLDFACTCEIRISRAHRQSRNCCALGFAAILTSGRCETPVSRALQNVEPKNVQPEMLRTSQPKAKNGGVGFLRACGIHVIQCVLLLRTCYKNVL